MEKLTERQIKERMAESGKTRINDMLNYMKARYEGQYDVKLAKMCARELRAEIV